VEEALRRLPAQELLDRNARLKRAMDLSLKGTFLPKELQERQTPLDFYLRVRNAAAALPLLYRV
jgi:ubiquinol-cytochrome c reductase subunit 7